MSLASFHMLHLLCALFAVAYGVKNPLKDVVNARSNIQPLGFIDRNCTPHSSLPLRRHNDGSYSSSHGTVRAAKSSIISKQNVKNNVFSLLGSINAAKPSWVINATVTDAIRLHVPKEIMTQLDALPQKITTFVRQLQQMNDFRHQVKCVLDTLSTALEDPSAFVEKHGRQCLLFLEESCRHVLNEAHNVYLRICSSGIYEVLTKGANPVDHIVRIIGTVFAIETLTNSSYLRVNYDLNPMEIFTRGQYYRLLTSLFLHNGLVHMLHNVRTLGSLGTEIIDLFGPKRMIAIYLVSGIVANYVSYIYHFAYVNGLPADVFTMTQSVVQGVGQSANYPSNTVDAVMDQIRERNAGRSFPLFMLSYIHTSIFNVLGGTVRFLLPFAFKSKNGNSTPEIDSSIQSYLKRKIARHRGCGASSAIYGLMGAICAYHQRFGGKAEKERVLDLVKTAIVQNIIAISGANIDYVSHLFGFITGYAMTLNM
ncbi:hypothetical protein BgAZ_101870 [Babesia gibsoni]|uniref:Peptidase S54 rhomboid domain-containing protein n=1 Tax=Babesia gibsoni TaxID=33632 RepID=A0AAD8USR2_BABGI|nr:hypothetical protein BgAZ_101870 [Babesia gibsoni]